MANTIQLWLDSTSDHAEPVYCVSLCAAVGGEIRRLYTYSVDDHADAWLAARDEARRRELPAVEIGKTGEEIRRYEIA